ncbi:SDR family oxidoreductase [Streptomyces sp. NPDC058470]|uniref:SDR family oxidoreductase n=1 Tax=Streptomyces sp. NPDC058470 TaxID=3346515 RepID=UPI00365EAAC1
MSSTTRHSEGIADSRAAHNLVVGANGFVGRWLVLELLTRGVPVAAAVRDGGRGANGLRQWLRGHGVDDSVMVTVTSDITRPDLGFGPADEALLGEVRDVFNVAALYRFGLSAEDARSANADGALHVLQWTATRPSLRRRVPLSGYRVGRSNHPQFPLPPDESRALYARLGAYEASKAEGDAAVRVTAPRLGVPLTVVNPSTVIGHSATGEAAQYIGLAGLVEQLWKGRLPALVGSRRTYIPVVAIDYLARFMAAVPERDEGPIRLHAVLDSTTPCLPDLVALLADHLDVRVPRLRLPVGVVRRLPRALTAVDPETLSFLSEDRYDTGSADQLARAAGLQHPPVDETLRRWASRLVCDRFGAATTGA